MKNIKSIYRYSLNNSSLFAINQIGLIVAFTVAILVSLFVRFEFSFDKFHSQYKQIYRVTLSTPEQTEQETDSRILLYYMNFLKEKYPEIEALTGINSFKKAIVSIDNKIFYSKHVYSVDSLFFKVFDYELLQGNKENLFSKPNQVAISESMAKTYFGTSEVLGKQIKITHQKTDQATAFTIAGILKDFPKNSHFKADLLCSFVELQNRNSWVYTYVLLNSKNDKAALQDSIQADFNKQFAGNENIPGINLQALSDIHLYSQKSRELQRNGNIKSIFLLISGALIILIIALVNFVNLQTVQYIKLQKQVWIKRVNGASLFRLIVENQVQIFIQLLIVLAGAGLLNYFLFNYFNWQYLITNSLLFLLIIALSFVLLVMLLGSIPHITFRRMMQNKQFILKPQRSYPYFIILQFTLAMVAISSTLVLNKQMQFMSDLQPGANETNMLVIPDNPRKAVNQFGTLRQRVLKHPEITHATAVMEEPAGNIMDRFQYRIDDQDYKDEQTIHILCVDSNFFNFFQLKAISGTVYFSNVPGISWEEKCIQLWQYELNNQAVPEGLREEVEGITDKYIINNEALKYLGIDTPDEAIGRRFQLAHPISYLFPPGEIIGVVNDFHYSNLYEPEKPLAMLVRKAFTHCFIFRFQPGQTQQAIRVIQNEWEKLYPEIPFQFELIGNHYQKVYGNEYMQSRMLLLFAVISLLLSIMGIMAMAGFMVERRTKEIGIRRVNGAKIYRILFMLNKNFLVLVVAACFFAIPLGLWVMVLWLKNFAYKTEISWWIFAVSALITITIVGITVSLQSFRAARRNPVESLRYE
ncbi:MAG: ABC transporter permease [Salinivirgaceae bacterium]